MSVEKVVRVLNENVAKAKASVRRLCRDFPDGLVNPHRGTLRYAVLTAKDAIPAAARERLALFLGPDYLTM